MNIDLQLLDARYGNEFPMPAPATAGSAGIDLRAVGLAGLDRLVNEPLDCAEYELAPSKCDLFSTGIAIHIADPNYAGFVYPRSGLGHKHGLILGNGTGVIDSDYQGEIKVSLWNRSDRSYRITPGERIAQLVIQPVVQPQFNIVDSLDETERGDGSFGSTGRA